MTHAYVDLSFQTATQVKVNSVNLGKSIQNLSDVIHNKNI